MFNSLGSRRCQISPELLLERSQLRLHVPNAQIFSEAARNNIEAEKEEKKAVKKKQQKKTARVSFLVVDSPNLDTFCPALFVLGSSLSSTRSCI